MFARAAAEHRADARRELAQAERLGDVVVGAEVETGDAVRLACPGRQHDDRQRRRGRPRPQEAADLGAVQDRQIQVEDQQVRRRVADRPEGRVAGRDDVDAGVALALERVLDELGDVDFVFDDQDAGRSRGDGSHGSDGTAPAVSRP